MKKPPPETSAADAVSRALDGERNTDIDRWGAFSQSRAAREAREAPPPRAPAKPPAGLARDGGPAPETVPAPPED